MSNRSWMSKGFCFFRLAFVSVFSVEWFGRWQAAAGIGKKAGRGFQVASIEVTPLKSTAAIGTKLQFKAVVKDANGQPLAEPIKHWYAAPFDSAVAEDRRRSVFCAAGRNHSRSGDRQEDWLCPALLSAGRTSRALMFRAVRTACRWSHSTA